MFDAERFINERVAWIRREAGGRRLLAAVSGGVDSTTAAVLGRKAVGGDLAAVFLDDGLMREGEPERVVAQLSRFGLDVTVFDVASYFFDALRGIGEPEEKRRALREAFYQSLSKIAGELQIDCLLQGTIAADVVETRRGVKTQHNVLEQIGISPVERFGYKVIEPLKELYKDEVRLVAEALGLPAEVSRRRPFPGPGLAIRVVGEVTRERVDLVRRATRIVEDETKEVPCFQAFPVLLGEKATGVSAAGDRRYGGIIVVRVVESTDAMTAAPARLNWEAMQMITNRLLEELPSVTRVLYDLTPKPPATIEFE